MDFIYFLIFWMVLGLVVGVAALVVTDRNNKRLLDLSDSATD